MSSKTLEEITVDSEGTNQNISIPNQALCPSYMLSGKLVNIYWLETSYLFFGVQEYLPQKFVMGVKRTSIHKPYTILSSLYCVFLKIVVEIIRQGQTI